MRTSGASGSEGWIMLIPIVALVVAASYSAGGPEALLTSLDGTVRHLFQSAADFVRNVL